MDEKVPVEGGGMNEYHLFQRKQMAPRNISPEAMGQVKAQVYGAIMREGFSMNAELAGWDSYSPDKKILILSGMTSVDDVRFVINREEDNDILVSAIAKKRELETVAQLAGVPLK